jgi:hypothetical protein
MNESVNDSLDMIKPDEGEFKQKKSEILISTPLDPIDENEDDFSPMPTRQFELQNDDGNMVNHTPLGFDNSALNDNLVRDSSKNNP